MRSKHVVEVAHTAIAAAVSMCSVAGTGQVESLFLANFFPSLVVMDI